MTTRRLLMAPLALASLWLSIAPAFAGATICLPTSSLPGLTAINDINTSFKGVTSNFSGASSPTEPCSAAPVAGQAWFDTSSAPYKFHVNDGTGSGGTAWPVPFAIDPSNHLPIVQIGGGAPTSLASASTTDLGSVPQAAITINGTTTITQFGSASLTPGSLKIVTFSGALTLTYDATKMILPTGASITTAAGDYALVLALTSTNVAVVAYNRASGSALAAANGSVGASAMAASALGMNAAINLQLNASVASNNLTIAVKGVNGSDPSPTNPVLVAFRDTTIANGTAVFGSIQAALSFTINAGNSLGMQNGVPGRIWVELICQTQSGTTCTSILLAASVQSNAVACVSLVEGNTISTGPGNAGGPNPFTFYTSVASLSGKAMRIAGYVEITESTAGTYATGATLVHVFGLGDKKPCDVVQSVIVSNVGLTNNSTTTEVVTSNTATIAPTSAINLIRVAANALLTNNIAAVQSISRVRRTNATGTIVGSARNVVPPNQGTNSDISAGVSWLAFDKPQTVSAQVYVVTLTSGGAGAAASLVDGDIALDEIMGSLEPANDNRGIYSLAG